MTSPSSSAKLEHTPLQYNFKHSHTLTFYLRTTSPQLISIQIQTHFSLTGEGKKALISPSLVRNHRPYSCYLPLWALRRTYSHLHTHTHLLDQICSNPVDMMQGELQNRCSRSDLQKPFNSFSLLDFLFYLFKST